MRRNKGFTLVELLAVIVILAVIALIATPVVLSMIESSRKGSAESSMLSYVDATEKTIVTKLMSGTSSIDYDGRYSVVGLTLTKRTAAGAEIKPCINTGTNAEEACTGTDGAAGTGQKINPSYLVFNIDLKGDQPKDNTDGNNLVVKNNIVQWAKLKFGKYYVSYFYEPSSGTTKYCSGSKYAADMDHCDGTVKES